MSPAYIFTASSPGTTVQASATSSATPSCGQWVQATAGDSCWKLSQDHCLEGVDAFLGLNPQLGETAAGSGTARITAYGYPTGRCVSCEP
ncbi:hypothetical protein PG990_003867 [Apiospora arundinis]